MFAEDVGLAVTSSSWTRIPRNREREFALVGDPPHIGALDRHCPAMYPTKPIGFVHYWSDAPMPKLLSFPNPVNEVSARLVAGGVVLMCGTAIVFRQPWLTAVIAYGFLARTAAGPRFSPLGLLATKVITPRLPVTGRMVPGPPKRFAQAIGAALSVSAAVLALGLGRPTIAWFVLGALAVAATLESVFALCLGCKIFAGLMRLGLVPQRVCYECADISRRGAASDRVQTVSTSE